MPVLSEQMTDTDPSVSTVFRDLQRIFCFRIMLALMVMLAVRATGRPSGMKATATETQEMIRLGTLIQSGYFLRSHAALLIISIKQPNNLTNFDLPKNNDNDNHEEHNGADHQDKVKDLSLECCEALLGLVGKLGDFAKDGAVSS